MLLPGPLDPFARGHLQRSRHHLPRLARVDDVVDHRVARGDVGVDDRAVGGHELGLTEKTFAAITAPPRPPSGNPRDLVLWVKAAYSLGFVRPTGGFVARHPPGL